MRAGFVMVAATLSALGATACKKPHRIGEYVWVDWDGREYPAYITERRGEARVRVHFDGYDSRWDEDVTLDRVKGRVEGPVTPLPPPDKVARALGTGPKPSASAEPLSPYKAGDRVRVSWRGSVYSAIVLEVLGPDRFRVHYDGHESEWDETVSLDRIETRR